MSDSIDADFTQLTQLAADLGKVPANAGPLIGAAFREAATKVRDDAREKVAGGSPSWSGLPKTIDYEVKGGGSGNALSAVTGGVTNSVTAEVGYNKARGGGKLGNIREFGAPAKNRGPHNDLANALEENQEAFAAALDKAVEAAERKAGL